MIISGLHHEVGRFEFDIVGVGHTEHVFFNVPDEVPTCASSEAALASALLPAMTVGEDLRIEAQVDERLLQSVETIQDIFLSWDLSLRPNRARYHRVTVSVDTDAPGEAAGSATNPRGTACFFSGGVDSFYSVVKNQADIDALVFVKGFDVALDDTVLLPEVSRRLHAAADALGIPLIEVETNVRGAYESFGTDWEDWHGAALATIGHLLGAAFSKVIIPASWGYAHLKPWGSHPLVDPLWSSTRVQIIHDGAEVNRLGKIRGIADERAAHEHLRVCWHNPNSAYNCGVCDKCIRTGVAAQIAGVSDRFVTLPSPSAATVANLRMKGGSEVTWQDYHDDLVRHDARPDLRAAIAFALKRQGISAHVRQNAERVKWATAHPGDAVKRAVARLPRK